MYNAASSVTILINNAFIIQHINLGTPLYWNIEEKLRIGANFKENFPDFLLPEGDVLFEEAVKKKETCEAAFFSNSSSKWIYLKVSYDSERYTIQFYDIVELNRAFVKLSKYLNEPKFTADKIDYAKAILLAQEEERLRIAETLHNEVGQLLTVAHLKIEDHSLQETKVLLKEAINTVRTLSFELSPTILQDFGLEGALRDMISKKLEKGKIGCALTFNLPTNTLGEHMDIAIFRITQELLNNIIKHAKAREVEIHLVSSGEGVSLTVKDDGINRALHDSTKETNGFGLKNIMDRVRLLGGEFGFVPGKNQGTEALVFIPLVSYSQLS